MSFGFFYFTFSLGSEGVIYEFIRELSFSLLMGRTLNEGQIEMVVVPGKEVNKLNDTFKELKARVAWVRLSSLLPYFTVLWPQWMMV